MKQTYSAGGIVLNNQGKVLVVNQNGNSWSLPKGHIDEGEDALTAAAREIKEESGVSHLRLVRKLPSYSRYRLGLSGGDDTSELKKISMFLYTTDQHELNPEDPDNPEAVWVEPRKVPDLLTHPKDKEYFMEVLPGVEEFIA